MNKSRPYRLECKCSFPLFAHGWKKYRNYRTEEQCKVIIAKCNRSSIDRFYEWRIVKEE